MVKGYADILAAGTFGIAGLGVLHTVGNATGTSSSPIMGYAGQAMGIGAVGMPLMATHNLMGQMYAMGEMASRKRRRR
jgi:hypothetical protein